MSSNSSEKDKTRIRRWRKETDEMLSMIEDGENPFSQEGQELSEARRKKQEARREEERVRRERYQKKIKAAKIAAFGRKNFQSGFSNPTNSQKEQAWSRENGSCVYCGKSAIIVETSFWWRIFPELGVVTACDACAKGDDLVEEEPNEPQRSSRSISHEVKDRVWNRDKGKCTECGANENLEFDHIIPHAKGGANTYRNIQLLCQDCNRRKSDNIG